MKDGSVRVVITSPLEAALVETIAGTDPRLEVMYPAELIPPPRYPADHALPQAETEEQRARWQGLLDGAEILFDFGPRNLANQLVSRPRLRWIQATSAGVGQFAARVGLTGSDIVVTTASGVHARPIAEFVLMSMLLFVKDAFDLLEDQRAHRWQRYATGELAGKLVTIVGVGRIGREIARAVRVFDARVRGTVRSVDGRRAEDLCLDTLLPGDRLDDLLPDTDFLVLCCPHTPDTQGLINVERLAALKRGAVLINVARGAIVDEPALIDALRTGHLRGAALDVFAREPLPAESPLWEMPNVLICPHSASTATTENGKIVGLFCENLRRYLAGEPLRNVLNKDLLY
jgi:phosphoglycerate dehydrogenase-like enzyme